jgi:NMD protein affecting ribosome stability and mRNA decay
MAKTTKGRLPNRIRRNLERYGDPYLPKLAPGEVAVCTRCRAVYQRRHWFFDKELFGRSVTQPATRQVICPACQKIEDNYPEGEVVLRGDFLGAHRSEIMNLVSNEEERAKGLNPLERIVRINESNGALTVTTTNEKLAQRIGRALQKAYQGEVSYRWSEDTKYLHVEWAR